MVGIIVVAHGNLSSELIATTGEISGEMLPLICSKSCIFSGDN